MMPSHYAELSLGAQTSYAELFDIAKVTASTKFAALRGSFHRRQIRGKTYVYFNFRDVDGRGCSAYVGSESARVARLIDEVEKSRPAGREEALAQRAKACIALGCIGLLDRDFRMIHKLAGYGFFAAGAVLLGRHAYTAMGNMLGVRWADDPSSLGRDAEEDDHKIAIGVPADLRTPAHDAITSLELGLLPIQEFAGFNGVRRRAPSDRALPVDFLAPDIRRSNAMESPALAMSPEPRKFLELLLEDNTEVVVFGTSGACLIKLPDPARFALYMLLVSPLSPPTERSKSFRNLERAATLIEWHIDHGYVSRIQGVWQLLRSRGPDWSRRADAGLASLTIRHPSAAMALS